MSKSLNTICLFFLVFPWNCIAQVTHNPRQYSDYVNQAELAIVDSNYQAAVGYYKQAFQYLQEPFGQDLHNFVNCAFLVNDKEAIDYAIPKYKERNYSSPSNKKERPPIQEYADSLYTHLSVQSKIDTNYRNFILGLVKADQAIREETSDMEYEKGMKKIIRVDSINMAKLKHYIDSVGKFPSESVVGNRSMKMDVSTSASASSSMLIELLFIHYAGDMSTEHAFQNPINLHLNEKVLAGEFPPDLYAHLRDGRGYGLDGRVRPSSIKSYYGAIFDISAKWGINYPEFNIMDRNTWKQEFSTLNLSAKELETINRARREMNMEPLQDLIKKIKYEMYHNGPFSLVNSWFLAVSYD